MIGASGSDSNRRLRLGDAVPPQHFGRVNRCYLTLAQNLPKLLDMKTIVLRQPWASLVAEGEKTIELRTWGTKHRGPLLIVAGRGVDRADAKRLGRIRESAGVTLCVVDLVDVREATRADDPAACCAVTPGEFAWVLAKPRAVTRVSIIGRLGLYEVELSDDELGL